MKVEISELPVHPSTFQRSYIDEYFGARKLGRKYYIGNVEVVGAAYGDCLEYPKGFWVDLEFLKANEKLVNLLNRLINNISRIPLREVMETDGLDFCDMADKVSLDSLIRIGEFMKLYLPESFGKHKETLNYVINPTRKYFQ